MIDRVTKQVRSRIMASIRSVDTEPELRLRKFLHSRGLRYRLHDKSLPGKPDLIFRKCGVALLVHGCFWHRHKNCMYATSPKSNESFWVAKFAKNIERDKHVVESLLSEGWRIGIIWECLFKSDDVSEALLEVEQFIVASDTRYAEWSASSIA